MTAPLKSVKVTLPWNRRDWATLKQQILAPITTVAALDTLMSKTNKLKLRQVSGLVDLHLGRADNREVATAEFLEVIAGMQSLLKRAPAIFRGREFYTLVGADNLWITREQAACIVAAMWFDLFNFKYLDGSSDDYPEPTLNAMWATNNLFALQCLLGYFTEVNKCANTEWTVERICVLRHRGSGAAAADCHERMGRICIVTDREESPARSEIVPCADFIGGDMFERGTTADNLVLLTHPELMVMTVFTARLGHDDAVVCVGAEKYSSHRGGGAGASWAGPADLAPVRAMIFIDADTHVSANDQFVKYFLRDLNKLTAGLAALPLPDARLFATHWMNGTCGNLYVKFIQIVLAAGAADVDLDYLAQGREWNERVVEFVEWLHYNEITIAGLLRLYLTAVKANMSTRLGELDVFSAIMDLEI